MPKGIMKRIKALQAHFEGRGFKAHVQPIDRHKSIGVSVQPCDEYFYPAKFSASLPDDYIIREMDRLIAGGGASEEHSLVYFGGPTLPPPGVRRKLLPGGAWPAPLNSSCQS